MDLFITYQIPTDLLSFDESTADATGGDARARLNAVKGHVAAMHEMIGAAKVSGWGIFCSVSYYFLSLLAPPDRLPNGSNPLYMSLSASCSSLDASNTQSTKTSTISSCPVAASANIINL